MKTFDLIIVGTGIAGLFCALHIPQKYNVLMITKDKAENSDSYLAQGGISTLKNKSDYNSYFEDTMKAGHYENKKESVEIMIKSSPEVIQELIDDGVEFDKTENGLSYTKEGAHSISRILHHKDVTGKEITKKLLDHVREMKNVQILEYTEMVDIISENNICKGIVVFSSDNVPVIYTAKAVVLATGGIGGLFENSTNFSHLTADSIAIALKHNIEVENINYIQIHPTTLYSKRKGRRFLITEALRGEGAYLLNSKNERFVDELLPRDVVSIAINEEMKKEGSDYVYLSVTHLSSERIKNRFPNIYEHCLKEGYDITKEAIPVVPAQHYFMGGIKVDINGNTSLKNLFAVGETSCNGVHGANRLASNSLLEGLVFAKKNAILLSKIIDNINYPKVENFDLSKYNNRENLHLEYKKIVLDEIKRRDEAFYDKWCNNAN